jgi:hypothetical protein
MHFSQPLKKYLDFSAHVNPKAKRVVTTPTFRRGTRIQINNIGFSASKMILNILPKAFLGTVLHVPLTYTTVTYRSR